jgi:CubicO group peptidase (beta-lactamase class C family)
MSRFSRRYFLKQTVASAAFPLVAGTTASDRALGASDQADRTKLLLATLVDEQPVTSKKPPGLELLDAPMLKCLKKIGCTGATLTVTRAGQTLYGRGYGWSDRDRRVAIQPDTPMSIASCDKPLTAAMIRQLAQNGKVDLNASVLRVLDIKPAGKVADKRVWDITINHLLEHKAG